MRRHLESANLRLMRFRGAVGELDANEQLSNVVMQVFCLVQQL